jgi:cytochrome c553
MFLRLTMKATFSLAMMFMASSALAISTADLKKKFDSEPAIQAKAGDGLYHQSGANSCLYCHGTPDQAGKVAAAAKLHMPKTWKIYKILGGDGAYAKNKAEFLKNMHDATVHLIAKGAVTHNVSYKEPWYDVSKGGGAYDSQMVGLGGPPSKAWVKKYEKSRAMTPEIAAESVYIYIKSLDTQGVF